MWINVYKLGDYKVLSELAFFSLKVSGGLIVMTGQSYLPKVINLLSSHMKYVWTLAYLTPGGQSPFIWKVRCNTFWKPLLLFVKKDYKGDSFGDVIKTSVNNNNKKYHYWGQSVEGFDLIIKRFTFPGQIVLDPFVGGGASAVASIINRCNFIGFDIDISCVEKTLSRLKNIENEL